MYFSEEEINALSGAVETFKKAIDALCKAIKPLFDSIFDTIVEIMELNAYTEEYRAVKHNTPYKKILKDRVYDKRTKLYKCRNSCRKRRNV